MNNLAGDYDANTETLTTVLADSWVSKTTTLTIASEKARIIAKIDNDVLALINEDGKLQVTAERINEETLLAYNANQ